MLLVALLVICCVVFALWSWMKPRRLLLPPMYPGALPVIGHGHMLIGDFQQLWKTEKKIYDYSVQNGEPVEVRLGPHSVFVITDPDDSLTVANNCLEKPYLYKFGKEMYDRGLVTAEVSVWKPHRKLLNPAFNQQVLHTFVEEYIIQAKILVSQLDSEVGKGPFDVPSYMSNHFLRIACRTSLGLKTDEDSITVKNYTHATEALFVLYVERLQRVWLHIPCIFNWSSYKKKQHSLMKVLKDITEAVITNGKSDLKLIGTSCETPEPEENYILPANSTYVISLYGLNRHSTWGADAYQFKPERWLDPATLPENPNTFASFSLGRRNCIGKLYGMLAVKTSVVHILRRYRIKSDIEKLVTRCDLFMKPVSGHQISLESRI